MKDMETRVKSEGVRLRSRLHDLFLSFDFFVGLGVGAGVALIPALIPATRAGGAGFFIALAAVDAAVAALVLAPMAVVIGSLNDAFRELLKKTPDGVSGVLVPFAQTSGIAAVGCALSLIVAVLTPLATSTSTWWLVWIAAGLPLLCTFWSLAACVQVSILMIRLLRTNSQAEDLSQRLREAQRRREAS